MGKVQRGSRSGSAAKHHDNDPACFRLSSSSALKREWEMAKASPTAQVPTPDLPPPKSLHPKPLFHPNHVPFTPAACKPSPKS